MHHDLVAETISEDGVSLTKSLPVGSRRFNRVEMLTPLIQTLSVHGCELRICQFVQPALQLAEIRNVRIDTLARLNHAWHADVASKQIPYTSRQTGAHGIHMRKSARGENEHSTMTSCKEKTSEHKKRKKLKERWCCDGCKRMVCVNEVW